MRIRNRGGFVNFSVVEASALALIKRNPAKDFRGFEPTSTWVRSIYRRCNFSRRAGTTTRPPVPLGIYEECKLTFLSDIERCIATHSITRQLLLNADQTPSSYVSVGKMTMAARNSSWVPIKGLTDKRNNSSICYLLKRRFPAYANNLPRKDESKSTERLWFSTWVCSNAESQTLLERIGNSQSTWKHYSAICCPKAKRIKSSTNTEGIVELGCI